MRGSRWSPFEDRLLRDLAAKNYNAAEMVPQIGRHEMSIRGRAEKLGIDLNKRGRHYALPKGDASTWNRAQRLCAFANVPLPLAEFVVEVSDINGVELKDLRSESRKPRLVRIRGAISKVARENGYTFPAIGRALNRDHTTIIYAVRHAGERLAA